MATPNQPSPQQAFLLFDELVELDAKARESRLAALAANQPNLAREVRELCDAHSAAGGFLDEPAVLQARTLASEALGSPPGGNLVAGDRIGVWQLVRPLGTGGMGEVWEVERADGQFRQRAALKLLKRGLDSEAVLRRFRVERELLVRLRHPAIAHLYDGGVAPDGRPYYVMELVSGAPITNACAERRLPIEARLHTFLTVCDAVDTAHRSLVVHRDLKPSNVLLGPAGEVKLLDFGIAKLLGDDRVEGDATQRWERLLTPSYAAPEQFLGGPVTTATDVYALGVMLFELLTGRLPHRRREGDLAQLARAVTHETVERPSAAARRELDEDSREQLAAGERERRARRLRGDLDWIVLRALAREPERRYPSAAALAADLRRHLDGRPVEARPDSFAYRASRFVRRNRVAVAAAAVVAAALVAGSAVAVWQARAARAEARRAEQESARAHEEAERARRETKRSERITDFLRTMILEANPTARSRAEPLSLQEVVRAGARRIEESLAGEPELQARLGVFFGDLLIQLDDRTEARRLIERSYTLATESPDVEPLTVADVLGSLGHLRYEERDLDAAEQHYREGLRQVGEVVAATPGDARALALQGTLHSLLANTLHDRGRWDEAIAESRRSLAILEELHGPSHREVAISLTNLGMMLNAAGRFEEAEPALRRSLQLHRELFGEGDAGIYYVATALGDTLLERGEAKNAVQAYEESLAAARAAFGPDHESVAGALTELAEAWLESDRLDRAEELARDSLARAEAAASDRVRGRAHRVLGDIAATAQRWPDAARAYTAGATATARHFGPDHPALVDFAVRAAHARAQAGEARAVTAELESLLARQRANAPPAAVVTALLALGEALVAERRSVEGVEYLREAVALAREKLGAERLPTARAELRLGSVLVAAGDAAAPVEGRDLLQSAITRMESLGRGGSPAVARAKALLAD